jgi:hypothetical protein
MAGFNHSSSFRRLALAGAVCGLDSQSAAQIVSDSRTEAQDAARQREDVHFRPPVQPDGDGKS